MSLAERTSADPREPGDFQGFMRVLLSRSDRLGILLKRILQRRYNDFCSAVKVRIG
jgi:hypothetical protein